MNLIKKKFYNRTLILNLYTRFRFNTEIQIRIRFNKRIRTFCEVDYLKHDRNAYVAIYSRVLVH